MVIQINKKVLFKKCLVFGLIILFISISISPGINAYVKKTEFCKNFINSITTVKEKAGLEGGLFYKEQINNLHRWINNFNNYNIPNGFIFSPEDIELKDDAFHDSNSFNFIEWWYFDAILNDDYSIHISIYVFSALKQNIVISEMNIYKNGEPIFDNREIYLNDDFYISTDNPLIILDGKQVMRGYINQTTGDWIYDVSLEFSNSSVDLQFIGCTKGWKGTLSVGGWAVILPKASVSGKISVNGVETEVVGYGYHDHNWDITIIAYLNYCWYWGRIISTNVTITWFVIKDTRLTNSQVLLVVNKGNDYYMNIHPDDINFILGDFHIINGRPVPYYFVLTVDNENVSLFVDLTAAELQFSKNPGKWRYCRYHVESNGYIIIDSEMEIINGIQIAEFFRFR